VWGKHARGEEMEREFECLTLHASRPSETVCEGEAAASQTAWPGELRACSAVLWLPETPWIQLPTATPAFWLEQRTFGTTLPVKWVGYPLLLGRSSFGPSDVIELSL
jgi:hypothetical protein